MKRLKSIVSFFFWCRGRINRKQWWLGNIVVYGFWWLESKLLLDLISRLDIPLDIRFIVISSILPAYAFTMLATKRLHDQGRTGRWLLLLPLLFFIIVFLESGGLRLETIRTLIFGVAGLWCIFYLGSMPGNKEKNRYGSIPVGVFFS